MSVRTCLSLIHPFIFASKFALLPASIIQPIYINQNINLYLYFSILKRQFQMLKDLRQLFILSFLFQCILTQNFKAGSFVSIQCPETKKIQIDMRTYAIILDQAQKNVKIQLQGVESQNNILNKCELMKNHEICVFKNFVSPLTIICMQDDVGPVNLQILQPLQFNELSEQDKSNEQLIFPYLNKNEKGIAIFSPLQSLSSIFPEGKDKDIVLNDIFVSNCQKSMTIFEQTIIIGVVSNERNECVFLSKIQGYWTFRKVVNSVHDRHQKYDFSLKNQVNKYSFIKENKMNSIEIFLKSEDKSLMRSLKIDIDVELVVQFEEGEQKKIRNHIMAYEGHKYPSEPTPMKIQIFINHSSINYLSLTFNEQVHYSLKGQTIKDIQIEENQLLLYGYRGFTQPFTITQMIQLQVHLHEAKKLNIYKRNIEQMSCMYKQDRSRVQILSQEQIHIPNNDERYFTQICLDITPKQKRKLNNYFSFLLYAPIVPIQLIPDTETNQILFHQEIKHFRLSEKYIRMMKEKENQVNKLHIKHQNCHVFATYNHNCHEISCCEHAHADEIPLFQKDLFLFAKNTELGQKSGTQSLIVIRVSPIQNSYLLERGNIYEGSLIENDYFTFWSQKKQKIQIICNSMLKSLLVLVNTDKQQFPSKQHFEYQSNEGILQVNSKGKTIYITIIKLNTANSFNKKVQYSLVMTGNSHPIHLEENKLFNDYYRKKSTREYILKHLCNSNEKIQSKINLRNSIGLVPGSSFYVKYVPINNEKNIKYKEEQFIDFSSTDISELFTKQEVLTYKNSHEEEICFVSMKVMNPTNYNFHANTLYFKGRKSQELLTGQFSSENLLSDDPLKIFSQIDPSKPTNVYIYSTIQEIKVAIKIQQMHSKQISQNSFANEYNDPSFSHHFYFPSFAIKQNNFGILLMKVSKVRIDKKNEGIKHGIRLIVTQDDSRIRSGSKLYYNLLQNSEHSFEYQLGQQLLKNNKNNEMQQIILQNAKILGNYEVHISLVYDRQVISKIQQQQNTISKNIHPTVVVKVDQIKQKLKDIKLQENANKLILLFTVKCIQAQMCSFLTSVQTSNSHIRELTPGTPEIFHINKHSMIVFVYSNYLSDDQSFKFKINRRQGFPNYQICTSKIKQRSFDNECLQQLQMKQKQDMNIFNSDEFQLTNYVSGRTHELDIDSKNPYYCINCVYYLALYSRYDVIEGSVFAINKNQPLTLQQGHSITTIVYRNHPDKYFIPSNSFQVIIYQIQGTLTIETKSEGQVQPIVYNQSKTLTIKYNLPQNQDQGKKPYYLNIIPANLQPSALYTLISVNSFDKKIILKDGVPYEMKFNDSKVVKYLYTAEKVGTLMISSIERQNIQINAQCEDKDYKVVVKEGSQLRSKTYIMFDPYECSEYTIIIGTKFSNVQYTLLVSSSDIITLPLGKQTPTILKYQTKLYQIYEVTVRQSTQITGIFKFCRSGDGRYMIFSNKSKLYKQEYDTVTQLNEETIYEQFKHKTGPGVFYIKVQFKGLGGMLQFTIFIENSVLLNEQKELTIYENRRTVLKRVNRVNYQFSQFIIHFSPIYLNLQIYDITYFAIQSNRLQLLDRVGNCNGQFFTDLASQHEQIKETKLNFTNSQIKQHIQNSQPLSFLYQTSSPYNFLTIVPIINRKKTQTTFHQKMAKYIPTQLKDGQVYSALTYTLGQIALFTEKYIDIHESEKLILIVICLAILFCFCTLLCGGIWIGIKYFQKNQVVYVMRQISQEQIEPADEDERIMD